MGVSQFVDVVVISETSENDEHSFFKRAKLEEAALYTNIVSILY